MSQERSARFYRGLKHSSTFFLCAWILSGYARYQKNESILPSLFLIANTLRMIVTASRLEREAERRERARLTRENPSELDEETELSPFTSSRPGSG